jgi:next-to-BRCA1 protein 1
VHANALQFIYGVRHKCLNCPDWDFCSECIKNAQFIHPRHRFVPIYEPLAEPVNTGARHYGIYCDGPLCKDKETTSHIEGVRYKCAVCHDTDFCANCEALPSNMHNHTHPLIKFKVPVRNVSITTMNEDKHGSITRLGDQQSTTKSVSTETLAAPSANAATQVQTVVDMKPTEEAKAKPADKKIEIRDLLVETIPEKIAVTSGPVPTKTRPGKWSADLDAHFVRDTIADGTTIGAGLNFVQVWTLRNPGPIAWPVGCSVRHVGGDNMLNLDNTRALSAAELSEASESNVIGRCVEPGEEVSFRVVMKAPIREGTAISYWRLRTADGIPFGHRLWCDIQVESPSKPSPVPATARSTSSSTSSMVAEGSNSTTDTSAMRQERWNQMKLQRLRLLQMAKERMQQQQSTEEIKERTARLHEDALERLRSLSIQSASQKAELEKRLHIQEVRKAAVERLLENRRKAQEASAAAMQPEVTPQIPEAPELPARQETVELPVEEKPVEAQVERSTMIFPQLDKESPASSTHEAISAVSAPSEATLEVTSEHSDEEFFEDAESVEVRSMSSEDDGFMTDEEYDILDASDEEMA